MCRLGITHIPTQCPVGTILCDWHEMCPRADSTQQLPVNDPGNDANPLEGAVHQAQEPRELQGVRSPQGPQLGAASASAQL